MGVDAAGGIRALLGLIGEDPDREGLRETPGRVVRAVTEMTGGYQLDPALILAKSFDVHYDEMICVTGVEFTSLCEHHLLPFTGTASVGYIPNGMGVVGLSKLARLVDCFARRLQVQERMTQQIADAIEEHLAPRGAGVVIRATHSCMAVRGVRKSAEMVTSALTGAVREDARARAEFLGLAR